MYKFTKCSNFERHFIVLNMNFFWTRASLMSNEMYIYHIHDSIMDSVSEFDSQRLSAVTKVVLPSAIVYHCLNQLRQESFALN